MDNITLNGIEYVKKKGARKELVISDRTTEHPFKVGKSYFFRAVTFHLIGTVVRTTGDIIELKDASWVADSGRFSNAIRDGKLDEVEPVGTAYLNVKSVVDAFPWKHKNPASQK